MDSPEVYKKYADIRRDIEILTEVEESLRGTILADLKAKGLEKEQLDDSTFAIVKRSSWEYTDRITKLEEKVKIAKVREQEKGEATETISESLRYTVKRPT